MASTSPGYGITIRIDGPASAQPVSEITQVISAAGAAITALDVVESLLERVVIDITCDAVDQEHADVITSSISRHPDLTVRKVSDRTFLLHLGGKIEIQSKVPLKTRDDLSRAYTPGVARICQGIVDDPADARRLTIKRNTVAVVTDGSAVLGLGNIGPAAALPVMEGKAALFKRFADVDAWPVCLDTQDVDEIVRTVQLIAPVYGGINLEDISAPRCFEVERRLRELLDIPVFHDDQHGTAVVVLAALLNACRLTGRDLIDLRVLVIGLGAAGVAVTKILLEAGVREIIGCDSQGALSTERADYVDGTMPPIKRWYSEQTNPEKISGGPSEAIAGTDLALAILGNGVVLLLHLGIVKPAAQHLHRLGAILHLRLFVLLNDDEPGGKVGDPDRAVGGVDRLATGARRAEDVDADVVLRDVDLGGLFHQRDDLDSGERRLALVGGAERADARQAVSAGLDRERAVGVGSVDLERRGLDARFFSV